MKKRAAESIGDVIVRWTHLRRITCLLLTCAEFSGAGVQATTGELAPPTADTWATVARFLEQNPSREDLNAIAAADPVVAALAETLDLAAKRSGGRSLVELAESGNLEAALESRLASLEAARVQSEQVFDACGGGDSVRRRILDSLQALARARKRLKVELLWEAQKNGGQLAPEALEQAVDAVPSLVEAWHEVRESSKLDEFCSSAESPAQLALCKDRTEPVLSNGAIFREVEAVAAEDVAARVRCFDAKLSGPVKETELAIAWQELERSGHRADGGDSDPVQEVVANLRRHRLGLEAIFERLGEPSNGKLHSKAIVERLQAVLADVGEPSNTDSEWLALRMLQPGGRLSVFDRLRAAGEVLPPEARARLEGPIVAVLPRGLRAPWVSGSLGQSSATSPNSGADQLAAAPVPEELSSEEEGALVSAVLRGWRAAASWEALRQGVTIGGDGARAVTVRIEDAGSALQADPPPIEVSLLVELRRPATGGALMDTLDTTVDTGFRVTVSLPSFDQPGEREAFLGAWKAALVDAVRGGGFRGGGDRDRLLSALRRLGVARLPPTSALELDPALGIRAQFGDSCVLLRIPGGGGEDGGCPVQVALGAPDLDGALRSALESIGRQRWAAVLVGLHQQVDAELRKLGLAETSAGRLAAAPVQLEIDQQGVLARIEGAQLFGDDVGGVVEVGLSLDGALRSVRVEPELARWLQDLVGGGWIRWHAPPRLAADGTSTVALELWDGDRMVGSLGVGEFTPTAFAFAHPQSWELGGGIGLEIESAYLDVASKQLRLRGATLRLPAPFPTLAGLELVASQSAAGLEFALAAESNLKVVNAIRTRLISSGVLPPGTEIAVQIDSRGVRFSPLGLEDYLRETIEEELPLDQAWLERLDSSGELVDRLKGELARAFEPRADGLERLRKSIDQSLAFDPDLPNPAELVVPGLGRWGWRCELPAAPPAAAEPSVTHFSACSLEWWPEGAGCLGATGSLARRADGSIAARSESNEVCIAKWFGPSLPQLPNEVADVMVDTRLGEVSANLRLVIDGTPVDVPVRVSPRAGVHLEVAQLGRFLRQRAEELVRQQVPELGSLPQGLDIEARLGSALDDLATRLGCQIENREFGGWQPDGVEFDLVFPNLAAPPPRLTRARLSLGGGLDLRAARVDLEALQKWVQAQLKGDRVSVVILGQKARVDGVELQIELSLRLGDRAVVARTALQWTVAGPRVADLGPVLLEALDAALVDAVRSELLPIHVTAGSAELDLEKARLESGRLHLEGNTLLSKNPEIRAPVDLWIPVRSGSFEVSVKPPDINGLLSQLLGAVDLPDLAGGLITVEQIDVVDAMGRSVIGGGGQIPQTLHVKLRGKIWEGFELIFPPLIISLEGIRTDAADGVGLIFNADPLLVGYISFHDIGGRLSREALELETKVSIAGLKPLIYVQGVVRLDLVHPARFELTGRGVLFSFLEVGRSETRVDLELPLFTSHLQIGGALSSIISLETDVTLDGPKQELRGSSAMRLFGCQIADGLFLFQLQQGRILITGEIDLKLFKASAEFVTQNGFRDATLTAGARVEIGGFDLGGAHLRVTARAATFGFTVLGLRLGLTVPSIAELTADKILELILRALIPDIDPKALVEAILAGNLRINPFASFGPDSGDFSQDGPSGDGDDGGQDAAAGTSGDAEVGGAKAELGSQDGCDPPANCRTSNSERDGAETVAQGRKVAQAEISQESQMGPLDSRGDTEVWLAPREGGLAVMLRDPGAQPVASYWVHSGPAQQYGELFEKVGSEWRPKGGSPLSFMGSHLIWYTVLSRGGRGYVEAASCAPADQVLLHWRGGVTRQSVMSLELNPAGLGICRSELTGWTTDESAGSRFLKEWLQWIANRVSQGKHGGPVVLERPWRRSVAGLGVYGARYFGDEDATIHFVGSRETTVRRVRGLELLGDGARLDRFLAWLERADRDVVLVSAPEAVFAVALATLTSDNVALETDAGWRDIGAAHIDGFKRLLDEDDPEALGKTFSGQISSRLAEDPAYSLLMAEDGGSVMSTPGGALWLVLPCWEAGKVTTVEKIAALLQELGSSAGTHCNRDPTSEACLKFLFGAVIGGVYSPERRPTTIQNLWRLVCSNRL